MWLIKDDTRWGLVMTQDVLDELTIATSDVHQACVLAPTVVMHQAIASCMHMKPVMPWYP